MPGACTRLQEFLKHGIITDANKDFGRIHESIWAGTDPLICPDIPIKSKDGTYTTFDADNLLYLLLEHNGLNDDENFSSQLITKLKENNYVLNYSDVGYQNKSYNIKLLHKGKSTTLEGKKFTKKEITDFFKDNEAYIVIDSGYITLLSMFASTGFSINRIINREVLNDSSSSSKGFCNIDGITEWLDIETDINGDPKYISYSSDNHTYETNNFFSKYILGLTTPQRHKPTNPNSKLFSEFLIETDMGIELYNTKEKDLLERASIPA